MMKVLTVFGTRPEAIKMAPIVLELNRREGVESYVAVTGQHRQMLDQVLEIFKIKPDYDLNIFQPGQSLTDITVRSLRGLEEILSELKPDVLLVQGDTTTVFAGSLSAFYHGVKIGHVEAGLRSHNLYSPFPEEANRKLTGVLSNYHFAPTQSNKDNLLKEGYPEENIYITGNTVIDALAYTKREEYIFEDEILNQLDFENKKVILLTCHRRENLGAPMERIFQGVRDIVEQNEDVEVVFPVHLNPKVREIAEKIFGDCNRVHRIEPLDYLPFSNLIMRSHIIVTDSGGIQEEAPYFGKPVLVVREETERWEGVEAGTARLLGTSYEKVVEDLDELLHNEEAYKEMAHAINPYGDGKSAQRIVDIVVENHRESGKNEE
ncbi:UDP-N-acetylglucosamine 2-epimerase (non-hydrolyzing) [Peptoniphilus sp. KCTC 25270]|nr:UDP-N-acetylglucosamine 2-epimerase (non-hydrolyzing) [Peptoniphilus sp. KCTC 25270]